MTAGATHFESLTAINNLALKPLTFFLAILLLQFTYCLQSVLKEKKIQLFIVSLTQQDGT